MVTLRGPRPPKMVAARLRWRRLSGLPSDRQAGPAYCLTRQCSGRGRYTRRSRAPTAAMMVLGFAGIGLSQSPEQQAGVMDRLIQCRNSDRLRGGFCFALTSLIWPLTQSSHAAINFFEAVLQSYATPTQREVAPPLACFCLCLCPPCSSSRCWAAPCQPAAGECPGFQRGGAKEYSSRRYTCASFGFTRQRYCA